jgi:hypothetical protein
MSIRGDGAVGDPAADTEAREVIVAGQQMTHQTGKVLFCPPEGVGLIGQAAVYVCQYKP